jgi:hypothetical protein
VAQPLRDPAGILERAPELAEIAAADAAVRRAVERGNPHAIHRVLWWGRLLGRLKAHRKTVDTLLAHRRLFLAPLRRMPVLSTVNGIGAKLYGSSDEDGDRTYVKTHFLVFAFVPLFPLAQYLVRDADRGWYFLGKVPMSAPVRFWNRLVVAGVLGALGYGAFEAAYASRHHDVYVLNALPQAIHATIGGVPYVVPPNGRVAHSLPTGRHDVRVTDSAGHTLETGAIDVSPRGDLQAWNVLGAASVYATAVWYGTGTPPSSKPHLYCGEGAILESHVDYLFTEPPHQIHMPEGQSMVQRRQLGLESGLEICASILYRGSRPAPALALARGLLAMDVTGRPVQLAGALFQAFARPEEAFTAAREARDRHPDSLEHHRFYQSAGEALEKAPEIAEEYRQRYETQRDSAEAAYLYARMLPHDDASRAQTAGLLQRFPDSVPLHRTFIYRSIRAMAWSDAVGSLAKIQKLDHAEWVSFVDDHISALAALGRVEEARALARDAFARNEGSKPELAAAHSWLGGSDADALLTKLAEGKPAEAAGLRVRFWTAAADTAMATLPAEDRDVYALLQDAHYRPATALDDAARLKVEALQQVNSQVLLLLLGEATRAGHAAARAQLDAGMSRFRVPLQVVHAYLETGAWSPRLDDLDLWDQGALHLARSRQAAVDAAERGRLRAVAGRCDPVGGYVRKALEQWPSA